MTRRTSLTAAVATVGLAALIALSGCTSGGTPAPSSSSPEVGAPITVQGGPNADIPYVITVNPDLGSQAATAIPSGTIEVATRAGTPPYEYLIEGTDDLRGADVDIANAIGAKLGLNVHYNFLEFAGILPAIEAKRYDFSIAAMGDTPEREKVADFVDYSTDSNSIVTLKGNPKGITGIDSLCGLNISSVKGSVLLGLLEQQNEKCDTKMNISSFSDSANALLQVQTGRADATMYQTGVALYLIKTDAASANMEVISNTEYGKGYNAIAFSKDNTAFRDLVQQALTELKADGIYDAIHDTWGLTLNKVDEITVNDGLKYNQPS